MHDVAALAHEPALVPEAPVAAAGTVGVVVVTRDPARVPALVEAVASLRQQAHPADDVLVVLDGAERRAARVREALPGTRVIATGRRLGGARARVVGARLLATQWVAFLDEGARAEPGWLAGLIALTGDDVLGVSGRSLPVYETAQPRWLPDELLWVFGCTPVGVLAPSGPLSADSGIVRRSLFLLLGGAEESHVTRRAAPCAWGGAGTFEHAPAAVVHQGVPAASTTWRFLLRRCVEEGSLRHRTAAPADGGTARRAVRHALAGRPGQAVGLLAAALALALGRQRARWADSRTVVHDPA